MLGHKLLSKISDDQYEQTLATGHQCYHSIHDIADICPQFFEFQ